MTTSKVQSSFGVAGNFVTMTELRKKISSLRDLLDFSPCAGSASVNEVIKRRFVMNDVRFSYDVVFFTVADIDPEQSL